MIDCHRRSYNAEGVVKVVVHTRHEAPERPPLRVSTGDVVSVTGERDQRWPTFVFVSTESGAGWIPATHVSNSAGRALVTQPYDTTELSADTGSVLLVLSEDRPNGWLWCRSEQGREGWIPVDNVSPIQDIVRGDV